MLTETQVNDRLIELLIDWTIDFLFHSFIGWSVDTSKQNNARLLQLEDKSWQSDYQIR